MEVVFKLKGQYKLFVNIMFARFLTSPLIGGFSNNLAQMLASVCLIFVQKTSIWLRSKVTRNVFKKDKRRQNKKGRKYNTRLSTCT